ncbi:phosphoribosylaminoimidazolesuccinocarboxamide synthase [Candidatus Micrarchaeota archaeon]|nr:phosphoribosylaminoimidazolesuccinocarboxamide synthase [Candidatus Micrarchaeota archaeon]
MEVVTETSLPLPLVKKGKVRDTYRLGDNLLMVSTDRLSAFDVVFNEGIPHKGSVLNMLSAFWFKKTEKIIDNHFISTNIPQNLPAYLRGRSMIVKNATPLRIECVVRGYLTGSALKEYQKTGSVCGIALESGLHDGSRLKEPIFTPSTKAETGHDENISFEKAAGIVGGDAAESVKKKAVELYKFGRDYALGKGLVLADTKFEFGYGSDGKIILIDEAMTPDSSRYWLKEEYDKGRLLSLDKQFARDYLEKTNWNKQPPPPPLPHDVVQKTSERYLRTYRMLTGKELEVS